MTTTLEIPKVQLAFEFQGKERLLNKHPRIQTALNAGEITSEAARLTPWFIRFTVPDGNGGKRQESFKLAVNDPEAIKQAKEHLKSKDTTEFSEFRKERAAKRALTFEELKTEWLKAGMPDATGHPRDLDAVTQLTAPLLSALRFWGSYTPGTVKPSTLLAFASWRRADCLKKQRGTGDRSIDKELGALSCMCQWALAAEKISANPFAKRPKFQRAEDISHCHEFMPESDEQWHAALRSMFTGTYDPNNLIDPRHDPENMTLAMRIVGGWLAFTGLVGLRPEEPQYLYRRPELKEIPATPGKLPDGTIFKTRDGQARMKVFRTKHGQNPFVTLHPAALDFLQYWTAWLDSTFPTRTKSAGQFARPLFPDPLELTKPICSGAHFRPLRRCLARACREAGITNPIKPKGFGRAYYVRVRRSQGADDSIIASELGQTTNGKLIRDTYGNPDDMAGGALFDWLPNSQPSTKDSQLVLPAWHLLNTETATNVIAL